VAWEHLYWYLLAVLRPVFIVYELKFEHFTAGGIEATSNAIGPAVGANVVFVDGAAELKFNEHFAAGGIEATSNAIGLTVGANVVSVDGAADIAENVNSSGVAMADSMQKND